MLDEHIQNDYGKEPIDSIDITITYDELDLLPLSDELLNNIGKENRSDILWLYSFVVNILDDILPETADHIKTKIKELLEMDF